MNSPTLVPFLPRHIESIQRLASKYENTGYTNVPHPYPVDGAKSYQEFAADSARSGDSLEHVVEFEGEVIGMAGILYLRVPLERQIGYWLDSAFWNRGLGRQVVARLIKICRDPLEFESIYADVDPDNLGSIKILEINGFAQLKRHRWPDDHHKFPGRERIRLGLELGSADRKPA